MKVLGISAFYHDSAAALVMDGEIICAAQEERFTRKKHDDSYPVNSINYCLESASMEAKDVDYVVFYDKPLEKFRRLMKTHIAMAPKGYGSFRYSMPTWAGDKAFQRNKIIKSLRTLDQNVDWKNKLLFSEHHLSHAASAFFPSRFHDSAILTMDGVGEWATTSLAIGQGNNIKIMKEINFPHSLGLLYSAFTSYTGFRVNSGEYKVMGLAPYGEPRFAQLIKNNLIDIKSDGSFRLNMEYFGYCTGMSMINDSFCELFGAPARSPESQLTQKEMDLAASIQNVAEEVLLKLGKSIAADTGMRNLCLAGGVALNCVANGKLLKEKFFDNIWIQPAAGDAGGALGAALAGYHIHADLPRRNDFEKMDGMKGTYLGPKYDQRDVERILTLIGARYTVAQNEAELTKFCAQVLAEGKAVGWHQGRMEFGPRALGARSILGDPRSPTMQRLLNLKVKYRESFRPFAPSILIDELSEWFELEEASPYMLLVANVNKKLLEKISKDEEKLFGIKKLNVKRSKIPAVTHVDNSARIQTVHKQTNHLYYALINEFYKITGCPILVNTSFNIRGEPIVNTPEDAYRCFMGTDIEFLVIGNCILDKSQQDEMSKRDYKQDFALD